MKTNKQIFLEVLPRKIYKGTECIDWINSVGYKVHFIYDDIEGDLEIIKYIKGVKNINPRILIKYGKEQIEINVASLKSCPLGELLKKNTSEFKYEIGTIFKSDKKDLIIINREYRKANRLDKKLENRKWYQYHCYKCGAELWVDENGLKSIQCGCCSGNHKVVEGINDIPTTAPWMIPYFQGGYDEAKLYSKGSNKKIYPICPDCGRIKNSLVTINSIYMTKSVGCLCKDGHSYPEKTMFDFLNQLLNNNFIWQYSKTNENWVNKYQYDFYFEYNSEKYIVETHGEQHYTGGFEKIKSNRYVRTLKEEQENDRLKKELALDNGIKEDNYIVVDCRKSELEFIKQNILNSKLAKVFDMNIINWIQIGEFACSNLAKIACKYKNDNSNLTTTQIGEIMKLDGGTISRYLKTGNELNWCNYNVEDEMSKLHSRLNKYGYPVEIFKNGVSLGTFLTGAELERQSEKLFGVRLHAWNILAVCKGQRESHWGFTFKFAK